MENLGSYEIDVIDVYIRNAVEGYTSSIYDNKEAILSMYVHNTA